MSEKITLEEALKLAFEIKSVFLAEFQAENYEVSNEEFMSIFMLQSHWNGKTKLSDIKDHLKEKHNFEEFKRIEVMISKRFTSLEEKGFIERIKCEEDKRETYIKVTPKGENMFKKFMKNASKRWEEGQND